MVLQFISLHDNNNDDGSIMPICPMDNVHQAALEDILYQMIVWLSSNQVIVPIQEYLVLKDPNLANMMMMIPSLSSSLLESTPRITSTNTPTEERKYDEIVKASSVASRTGSMSNSSSNNNTNIEHNRNNSNDNNNKNDEYIWHTLYHHCFRPTEHPPHAPPKSPEAQLDHHPTIVLLLLECSYRTGIEERILRNFVTRHRNLFRIIVTQSPPPPPPPPLPY